MGAQRRWRGRSALPHAAALHEQFIEIVGAQQYLLVTEEQSNGRSTQEHQFRTSSTGFLLHAVAAPLFRISGLPAVIPIIFSIPSLPPSFCFSLFPLSFLPHPNKFSFSLFGCQSSFFFLFLFLFFFFFFLRVISGRVCPNQYLSTFHND